MLNLVNKAMLVYNATMCMTSLFRLRHLVAHEGPVRNSQLCVQNVPDSESNAPLLINVNVGPCSPLSVKLML